MTGTGGTITFNDTGIAGGVAAPASTTLKGRYEHVGNFTNDANISGTEVSIYIVGNLDLGGSGFTYTGVTPFAGPAARAGAVNGTGGAGLSPGQAGTSQIASQVEAPSGGGNGGAGGRGASTGTNGGILGGPASPIEACLRGSSGATGGFFTSGGGNGGDAGGSLIIEASGSITFCNINLNGTAGTAGSSTSDPGGSGGAGGGLSARAGTTATIGGGVTIQANGGAGGAGGGATKYGGAGGGGGKVEITAESATPTNSGTVTVTGGAAGTSTSAATVATAGSTGVIRIIKQKLMRYAA